MVTEKQTRTSRLLISRALPADSGNYTCAPSTAESASVLVHVLNGMSNFQFVRILVPLFHLTPQPPGSPFALDRLLSHPSFCDPDHSPITAATLPYLILLPDQPTPRTSQVLVPILREKFDSPIFARSFRRGSDCPLPNYPLARLACIAS